MEFLREGETLQACLERYPEYRERLRPLLEIAQTLQGQQPEVAPSLNFLTQLKSKLTREEHEGR
jgi:hypothetical protein